jgi:hypothetical protein
MCDSPGFLPIRIFSKAIELPHFSTQRKRPNKTGKSILTERHTEENLQRELLSAGAQLT